MDNGTSRKKMAYQTKKQKEYLLAYEKTNLIESLHEDEEAALKKLQLPEASWTLPELLASGRKFTYEFNGKTEEKIPDNSFLTGYGALRCLISSYSSLAGLAQCMEDNTIQCKEYLYLAAYCQKCICRWPDHKERGGATDFVSLSQLTSFYMALIADADMQFTKELGELLSTPEYQRNRFLTYRGSAAICLATGDKDQAIYYAEKMKEEEPHTRLWQNYAHCICAIAASNADDANEDICSIVSSWRRTSGPPRLLVFHAIGLAKIAVQHGLDITIDTMDCPQALIQPALMDYSHLDLPRPKYGFPWEK